MRPPSTRVLRACAPFVIAFAVLGCSDDNSNYAQLSAAAEELGSAIAGDGVALTVLARESACPVPSSCPDVAHIDLPGRPDVTLDEVTALATSLGWDILFTDDRLVQIEMPDDGMIGSVSIDSDGRIGVLVSEN